MQNMQSQAWPNVRLEFAYFAKVENKIIGWYGHLFHNDIN